MRTTDSIPFLQNRIEEIGSALFHNLGGGVLKFPTSVVSILKVDELANIWFFANRPEQQLQQFDRNFPAEMQIYRKGQAYYMQITGQAYIVDDPEELNGLVGISEEIKARAFDEMVLVKVKITSAKYYATHPRFEYKHSVMGAINRFCGWLFNEPIRKEPYVFQPLGQLGMAS